MKLNKSLLYILPLIKGWSADADYPINCFANTQYPDCIVARYRKDDIQHLEGIVINATDDTVDILYQIKDCYIDDYRLIMEGKYSKINDDTKSLLTSKAPTPHSFQIMEDVLYKRKKIKRYLEKQLEITNLDEYCDEYESKFGEEETLTV